MKKVNIRSLLIKYIAAISAVLISSSIITFILIAKNESVNKIDYKKCKVIVNEALSYTETNLQRMQPSTPDAELNRILKKNSLELLVFDLDGQPLYGSKEKINIKYVEFEKDHFFNYIAPVLINERVAGNCLFSIPKELIEEKIINNTWKCFLPLGVGALVTIYLLIKMFKFIEAYVLSPAKELRIFADNISKGRYNNKLKYDIDSEMTSLCTGVELMQEELQYSLDRQRALERERKELIACISHDLKTPLSSIKAYVGAIKDGYAKDENTLLNYIKIIDDKSDNILTLLNDFFEHSKADLGELKISKAPQYSREFFLRISEAYKLEFDKKDIKFIIANDIPNILINIDALRIEQVLFNLFQNAMKYTSAGGTVHFAVENHKEFIKIYVRDTGTGISNIDIHYIFDKFYRGEKEFSKEYHEGAGLGLYISKYIVEAHDGEIYAESKLSEGSTFYFTIPKI